MTTWFPGLSMYVGLIVLGIAIGLFCSIVITCHIEDEREAEDV